MSKQQSTILKSTSPIGLRDSTPKNNHTTINGAPAHPAQLSIQKSRLKRSTEPKRYNIIIHRNYNCFHNKMNPTPPLKFEDNTLSNATIKTKLKSNYNLNN